MSARRVEAVLARLYVDDDARKRFLSDALEYTIAAGLDADEARQLAGIDRVGLMMAARSFAAKRSHQRRTRLRSRLVRLFRWP